MTTCRVVVDISPILIFFAIRHCRLLYDQHLFHDKDVANLPQSRRSIIVAAL